MDTSLKGLDAANKSECGHHLKSRTLGSSHVTLNLVRAKNSTTLAGSTSNKLEDGDDNSESFYSKAKKPHITTSRPQK